MDTIPKSKDDQKLLGSLRTASNAPITPDNPIMTEPRELSVEMNQTDRGTRAAAACSSTTGVLDKTAPGPNALLPSSVEVCTSPDVSQSLKPESLKSTTTHTDPDSEDLCAAILLACLFCQPLDCLLATFRGCSSWTWSLCTSMCGCKSTSLQPLLDVTPHCDLCDPVGPHCCLCDCAICDICRQTTECLDFAMEVSQMLYH